MRNKLAKGLFILGLVIVSYSSYRKTFIKVVLRKKL